MECLGKLPSGTPVLVRGDVDAKPGPTVGDGDIRLRSMKDTLKFGQERGWKQIVFGHVGREPEKSLAKVAARLGEILGCKVTFIEDWLDPATTTIKDEAAKTIAQSPPGSVIMLQNTRKYDIERVLVEGQAGRRRQTGRKTRQAGQRVRRKRWPRSTSTRRFRPAASTPRAWSCPPPWKRWPWASTRPSSSTAT